MKSKNPRVQWDEPEWDRLAELVISMRRNSTDGIASIANRAQKQFPQDRQRPGILTTTCLQPLIDRIKRAEHDLQLKAEKHDEVVARLTFFEDAPATKEELLKTLSDEEVIQHFLPRVLQLVAPADIVDNFKPEVLFDCVTTAELAAVLARRLVMNLERPINVTVQLPETKNNHQPHATPTPKSTNGRKRRILVIGIKNGDQRTIVDKAIGDICEMRYLAANQIKSDMLPKSVDAVVMWSKTIGHADANHVRNTYRPKMITELFGGVDQMIHKVRELATALR